MTELPKDSFGKFDTTVIIQTSRIMDLLTTAFEFNDMVRSWLNLEKYEIPEGVKVIAADGWVEIPKEWQAGESAPKYAALPLMDGGAVILRADHPADFTQWRLDKAAIEKGLRLLLSRKDANGHVLPDRHADNFLTENEDAETADVFIQLCLFGEIVFG